MTTCGAFAFRPVDEIRNGIVTPPRPASALIDTRPILVVEFPPQHVAEKAYFRQIDDGKNPPDVALEKADAIETAADFKLLDGFRSGVRVTMTLRVEARARIKKAKLFQADEIIADEKASVVEKRQAEQFKRFCAFFDDAGTAWKPSNRPA